MHVSFKFLEISRVSDRNVSNFNVLHMILASDMDEVKNRKFSVSVEMFYLQLIQLTHDPIQFQVLAKDCGKKYSKKDFDEFDLALNAIGILKNDRQRIYCRLVGILALGNINFVQNICYPDYANIENEHELFIASKLLDVDSNSLHRGLTERPILEERLFYFTIL